MTNEDIICGMAYARAIRRILYMMPQIDAAWDEALVELEDMMSRLVDELGDKVADDSD